MLEFLKAVLFGIVEGITEWLPISSTGHMILLNEFVRLEVSPKFWELFLVVIQLGAILAVVLLFWKKIFPIEKKKSYRLNPQIMNMWYKVVVACIPAAVVGLLFDDILEQYLYNYITVSLALILFGVAFIIIEEKNKTMVSKINTINEITWKTAIIIRGFQLIAAIFPGTSRSGATILGALLIGVSRTVAAEFTFFLAIPVMLGASLLKLLKYGFHYTATEWSLLAVGMVVAFLVSVFVIKFLMDYIKKHDFKIFGWYRIILGSLVLLYFGIIA